MSNKIKISGAVMSECDKYRYALIRSFGITASMDEMKMALFVMLNPSVADAVDNDPTIRRCINFTKSLGYNTLVVANLYAYRATDPHELLFADDPVGPCNDLGIGPMLSDADVVICAWGAHAKPERVDEFIEMANKAGVELKCLGTNKDGSPKHPLYLAKDTQLQEFVWPTK